MFIGNREIAKTSQDGEVTLVTYVDGCTEGFTQASFDVAASVEPREDHMPLMDTVQKATEEIWNVCIKYNLRMLNEIPMVLQEIKKHTEHAQKAALAKAMGETDISSV